MKLTSFITLIFLLQTSTVWGVDFEKSIKYFETKCNSEQIGNKLILIDNTDLLSRSQKQFVKDNFIKTLSWENEGERVTIVSLYNEPVALMPMYSFCTPKPVHAIDEFMDPIAKIRAENMMFRDALLEAFERIADKSDEVDNTLLMEAITEVYRSARYKFNTNGKRELILVSDLYQHSDLLSFFRECNKPIFSPKKPLTCPSINEVISGNIRFKHYLEAAKPKLSDKDQIKIFYLNVNNRVDRSAEEWWRGYFNLSGLNSDSQIEIIPELQN